MIEHRKKHVKIDINADPANKHSQNPEKKRRDNFNGINQIYFDKNVHHLNTPHLITYYQQII